MFCGQVSAEHSGPFVGAFIGENALMNAKSSDDLGDFALTFKPALLWSAVLGWDFEPGNRVGEGRVELEYTRRSNPLDKVKFAEGSVKGGGDMTAESLLVNFIGVAHDKQRQWSPYVGIGLGAVRIKASGLRVSGQPLSNDSTVVFAYQLGAGIDIALNNYLNLDLGYRFLSSIKPKFTEADGHEFTMENINHSAVFGLRVGF
jgi:opacity protein-like surface antigen